MTNNLSSSNILVTRPGSAGRELCALIATKGGQALHFPTIVFVQPADQAKFIEAVKVMGSQDWLVFNSPQAVKATVPKMRSMWPNFPDSVKFSAVGAGTAKALKEAGYIVTIYPEKEWSSEGLLALPEFQVVKGQKIMIVRGEGGRGVLEQALSERGATVNSCVSYQRVLPQVDVSPCLAMLKKNKINVVVAGSFESVNNLKLLLGEAGWPQLREIPLLVMSERIKTLASEMGFQTIWVTNTANAQAILDDVTNHISRG